LPSEFSNKTSSNFINGSSLLARVMAQIGHEWDNKFRLYVFQIIWRHDAFKHSWGCQGGDCVDIHIIFLSFLWKGLSETVESQFGRGVIDLAEVTEKACCRCGVDNSTELLLSHNFPSCSGAFVSSENVNLHDKLPVDVLHFLEWHIPQNTWVKSKSTCVIDEYVHLAEIIKGGLNNLITELYRVVVSNSNTSLGLDLLNDKIGSRAVFPLSDRWGAEIIDNNFGASASKKEGIGFSQSSSCACDNDYLIIELQTHFYF